MLSSWAQRRRQDHHTAHLLGLTRPTSGEATVDGQPYRRLRDPIRVVGAVLEGLQFHPGRSGRNHLRVLAAAAGCRAAG